MLYISLPSAFLSAGYGIIFLPFPRAEGQTGKPDGGNTLWTEDKGRFPAGTRGMAGFVKFGNRPLPLRKNNPCRSGGWLVQYCG